MEKYRLCILIILATSIFYSCSIGDKKTVTNLYKEREYLLKEFKNKSILRRGKIFFQLSYYKDQSVNTFFFEKKNNEFLFKNDTLQYPISDIEAFTPVNSADNINHSKALSNELNRLLKIMEDFKIDGVSAAFKQAGIDMKIYFGDYKALLYVSNIAGIKNGRWMNYVKSGEKISDNWYYVRDELEQ